MTLKQLRKKISAGEYSINDSKDFSEIKKYWHDINEDYRIIISKKIIKNWDHKKSKLSDNGSLKILYDYLNINDKDYTIHKIKISGQYDFKYIKCEEDNIRQENIFKLNFLNIVQKLNEYFPSVKILIDFEASTIVDTILKKHNCTYKHDVLIKIQPNTYDVENEEIFEVVLEYFEKIHNKFNDDDKKISTNIFSDSYLVFSEKTDNMKEFIIKSIYSIIELICASMKNGKYELSKILYFHENYKSKNNDIALDVELFNKIINVKKSGEFNFKQFYEEIQPFNPDTGDDLSFNEFIEYIQENYNNDDDDDDENKFNFNNVDNIYSSDVFEKLILYLNINMSEEMLKKYKNIYMMALDKIFIASDKIISILEKQRKKKLQLPQFVKNIQKFHKDNLNN